MDARQNLTSPEELERVIITSELEHRPIRKHDPEKENAAFRELADRLATRPESTLSRLVELTLDLCSADTAGISLEETNEKGERIFRWIALAGELKQMIGGTTPRNFSPCGVCVDQDRTLLMSRFDGVYPYFKEAPLPFMEALLIPWGVAAGPVGTLWIVAHSDKRKFDREDVRLMNCMAAFVAGALQLKQTLVEKEHAAVAAHLVSEMAHHLNNPLQGAILALYSAKSGEEMSPRVREMVTLAEKELTRVTELSAAMLRQIHSPSA